MAKLNYGLSHFFRDRGNFPALPVINMFAEEVPVEESAVLQSRPGLQYTGAVIGAGPVKAIYQIDGVLNGELFAVSGTGVFADNVLLGNITGNGPAKLAGYETFLFANAGEGLYGYDGSNFSSIPTPDNFDVSDICVGASRLVVVNKDAGRFYWSDTLTDNIDALSFATAENSPDKLKACLFVGDVLILFGSETVEFWPASTDADNPFQPLIGRVFPIGIRDTGCATRFGSTFAWVTNHNQVCLSEPENVISYPGLEADIEDSSTVSLWTFFLEGNEFLAVRLDDATHVFSSRSKRWSEFKSYDETNWIPQCYGGGLFGSSLDGQIIEWADVHTDFDGVLERKFRAGSLINGGAIFVSNLSIRTDPGHTPYLSGNYDDPTLELSWSKNQGNTWSPYRGRSLGASGNYKKLVQWRSLGMFSQPGMLFEFRLTDPVPLRVSGVYVNEAYGGN